MSDNDVEVWYTHRQRAALLLDGAQHLMDEESYKGRTADAQAAATIALAHSVLAVADAINEAVAELPVSR